MDAESLDSRLSEWTFLEGFLEAGFCIFELESFEIWTGKPEKAQEIYKKDPARSWKQEDRILKGECRFSICLRSLNAGPNNPKKI